MFGMNLTKPQSVIMLNCLKIKKIIKCKVIKYALYSMKIT